MVLHPQDGWTPLYRAADIVDIDLAMALIKAGADLDRSNKV
jgi:ankyrin repeat protein